MGQNLCSPATPGVKPEGTVTDVIALLKKANRPAKRWEELAPSVDKWYEALDSILKSMKEKGVGGDGADMEKVKRTAQTCMGTIKSVHYWVKEINGNFNQGTDGPMIAKASAVRLERAIKPHLEILEKNRDECLSNPSTFLTYSMMSVRPAFKEYMRWVENSWQSFDDQVLVEMELHKEQFNGSGSTPTWQAPEYSASRPIELYCDGHFVGAMNGEVYSKKLNGRL